MSPRPLRQSRPGRDRSDPIRQGRALTHDTAFADAMGLIVFPTEALTEPETGSTPPLPSGSSSGPVDFLGGSASAPSLLRSEPGLLYSLRGGLAVDPRQGGFLCKVSQLRIEQLVVE